MFVECEEGSTEEHKVRKDSDILFKEVTSDLYYVFKDTHCIFTVGAYVSKTHVLKTFSGKHKVAIIISSGICSNFDSEESCISKVKEHPFRIGDGKYAVTYKEPWNDKHKKFVGVCENFCTVGKSAFWDIDKNRMLLIDYNDIIGLFPLEGEN